MTKNSTKICAVSMGESVEQIVKEMAEAKRQGADLVEISLDSIKGLNPGEDLKTLIDNKPLPVLVAYRPKWNGGQYEGDEISRLDALLLAMELGSDYVEVELKVASDFVLAAKLINCCNGKVIVSRSVVGGTSLTEDLGHLVAQMQSTGADIIKLVTDANDITDLADLLHLLSRCQAGQDLRFLSFSMSGCFTLGGLLVMIHSRRLMMKACQFTRGRL